MSLRRLHFSPRAVSSTINDLPDYVTVMGTASLVSSVAMDYPGCALLFNSERFPDKKKSKTGSNDCSILAEFINIFNARSAKCSQYSATFW
jgi:hypothetical protein